MKRKAARLWVQWHRRGYKVTADLQRRLGVMAAMHCTHMCAMCKYEKHFDVPHLKAHQSVRIVSL